MLHKNIPKIIVFVTSICVFCFIFSNCSSVSPNSSNSTAGKVSDQSKNFNDPEVVGRIKTDEITESSGLVQSRCDPRVFWTHNDSGDKELIYAINEKGERLGTWKVAGAKNNDWEDMATLRDKSGKCFIFFGDIGNNSREKTRFAIYKVGEPTVTGESKKSTKKMPLTTDVAEAIAFSYPDGTFDAETLLVHPGNGDIFVVTKTIFGGASVFKIGPQTTKVGEISVPAIPNGFLTGGEISPDGRRVIISDYVAAYELRLPEGVENFDEIWKQTPDKIILGDREQGEAICYSTDGKKIYATSEKKNSPVIRVSSK